MEIKIGELEVDNNRFKVEIDELRVARNQVKWEPIATQLRHKMSHRGSVMLFLDIYLWFQIEHVHNEDKRVQYILRAEIESEKEKNEALESRVEILSLNSTEVTQELRLV